MWAQSWKIPDNWLQISGKPLLRKANKTTFLKTVFFSPDLPFNVLLSAIIIKELLQELRW